MARQVSNGPYAITTAPSLITCQKCRRSVLAATVHGLDVHIDTATLNPVGEMVALIEGRATYGLRGDRLYERMPEKIRAGNTDGAPVMAQHACKPVPPEHIDQAWSLAATAIVIQAIGGVVVNGTAYAEPPF